MAGVAIDAVVIAGGESGAIGWRGTATVPATGTMAADTQVTGAIEGAKSIGISAEEAAQAAAAGALEAAEEIGEKAVHAVTDVAAGGVGGVKNILKGGSEA